MKRIFQFSIFMLLLIAGGCRDPYMEGVDPVSGTFDEVLEMGDKCAGVCANICPRTTDSGLPRPVLVDCSYSRIGSYAQFWWTNAPAPSGYVQLPAGSVILYYSEHRDGPYNCIGTLLGDSWNYYFSSGEDNSRTYYYRLSAIFVDGSGKHVESPLSVDCWEVLPE